MTWIHLKEEDELINLDLVERIEVVPIRDEEELRYARFIFASRTVREFELSTARIETLLSILEEGNAGQPRF